MGAPLTRLTCLLSLLIGSSASAVTMEWTHVGDPGNSGDSYYCGSGSSYHPCGAVAYGYEVGTYEVTNAQYAEFLNAKAAADPLGLYNTGMAAGYGGITRSGSSGSYTYSAIAGRENMPVNYVSFYDALRFANWLSNGQGTADTETGSYALLGGTATPSNGASVTRDGNASIVLPTEDEWYKAAYYNALSNSYFDYPAGSDTQTVCSVPTATPNRANCNFAVGDLTIKGAYTGSPSPYGTFDQGGNVSEWNHMTGFTGGSNRIIRGGSFNYNAGVLRAAARGDANSAYEDSYIGFRLVMIPEPSTGLLVSMALLGLAGWRRTRAPLRATEVGRTFR